MIDLKNKTPKYLQLKALLKKNIESGAFSKPSAFPTEHELMKKYKLSRGTVRSALSELKNEKVITRKSGSGTFLKSDRPQKIGILVGETENNDITNFGMSPRMFQGFLSAMAEFRIEPKIIHAQTMEDMERKIRSIVSGEAGVKGVLLGSYVQVFDKVVRELHANNIPYIFFDAPDALSGINNSYISQKKAGYISTNYLIKNGHKQIACICSVENNMWLDVRFSGYKQAMRESGISVENGLVIRVKNIDEAGGRAAAEKLLDSKKDFTAIFAVNHTSAKGAIEYLLSKGIKVPDQVSLSSVDDFEFEDTCPVPLTTAHLPLEKLAFEAVRGLLDLISGKAKFPYHPEVESELRVRKTVKKIS